MKRSLPLYAACFAAQMGALGRAGQERLRRSSVLIVGAGGLGTSICTTLALSGVGRLFLLDPQRVEIENLNRYPFMRPSDVGKLKVDVVSSFFDGRPHVSVVPYVGRAEDLKTIGVDDRIDLVVSASNSVSSRIAVARAAVQRSIPHVSAALADGRDQRRGIVTTWSPVMTRRACPACFLRPGTRVRRDESLLATVVSVVGAAAAAVAVRLLAAGKTTHVSGAPNCVSVDIDRMSMESFTVIRRSDCPACGQAAGQTRGAR